MELASRILSIVLGAAVMVFVLWPVTIPVGFGEVWWASQQAQSRLDAPPAAPSEPPVAAEPQAAPVAPSSAPATPDMSPPRQPDQTAALDQAPTSASPPAVTKLYRRVTVRDGGTLHADGVVIRLAGIAAREATATCKDERGKAWPCGIAAKTALTRLIRSRAVTCTLPKGGEHNIIVASCSVGGVDLATWMVRQGWAAPKEPADPALAEAATAAKGERLGVWRVSD